jgi:hypothetical protein
MSTPRDFCIGCINDEYPEGLQVELEKLRAQLADYKTASAQNAELMAEMAILLTQVDGILCGEGYPKQGPTRRVIRKAIAKYNKLMKEEG